MTIALILAAGSGERLGADRPKALVELAGRPLVQWSVDVLREVVGIERIVIALPPGTPALSGVISVDGGSVRSESVRLVEDLQISALEIFDDLDLQRLRISEGANQRRHSLQLRGQRCL